MRIIPVIIITVLALFWVRSAFAAIAFTISNPVQNGDEVTIDVSLSGLTSTSCNNGYCYLQAAFTSQEQIKYFGFTKNNSGQWYEYISKPTEDYIQSTFFSFKPVSGSWSGQLSLKINSESTSYRGSGIYNINAWRYSGKSSSGPSGSSDNTLEVNIQGSSSPSPSPNSSQSTNTSTASSFTISAVPSHIDSIQTLSTSVSINLPNNPNTKFYLKGAFKKADSTNYFGLTKVGGSWIKNSLKYSDQLPIITDSVGNWSGSVESQIDAFDSGYSGSDDYIFKVARYTESGSGPIWSNEKNIKITAKEILDEGESLDLSKLTAKSREILAESTSSYTELPEVVYSLENYRKVSTRSATPSASAEVVTAKEKTFNPLIIILGAVLILGGIGVTSYIFIKNRLQS